MSNWTAAEIQEMQRLLGLCSCLRSPLVVVRTVATFKLRAPHEEPSSKLQWGAVKALILKTNSTCFTVHAKLCASHHVTCLRLPQWWLFGKEGILHLLFRQTRWQIAAFTFLQTCHLLYLKGACLMLSHLKTDFITLFST